MISLQALSRVELEGGFAHSVSFRVPRSAPWHSGMRSFERRGEPLAASHVADRRRGCTKLIAPFEPRKERTDAMGFFSKDIKTMDDLFVHALRDIYYAEKQIVQALPEMIDKSVIRSSSKVFRPIWARPRIT